MSVKNLSSSTLRLIFMLQWSANSHSCTWGLAFGEDIWWLFIYHSVQPTQRRGVCSRPAALERSFKLPHQIKPSSPAKCNVLCWLLSTERLQMVLFAEFCSTYSATHMGKVVFWGVKKGLAHLIWFPRTFKFAQRFLTFKNLFRFNFWFLHYWW